MQMRIKDFHGITVMAKLVKVRLSYCKVLDVSAFVYQAFGGGYIAEKRSVNI